MGNYIFCGGGSSGVVMSSNNGQNWVSIGLTGNTTSSIAVYQNNLIVRTRDFISPITSALLGIKRTMELLPLLFTTTTYSYPETISSQALEI